VKLKQLKKLIDDNFQEPFVPKGVVGTYLHKTDGKELLTITIGGRDVEFDDNGKVYDTGTCVGGKW